MREAMLELAAQRATELRAARRAASPRPGSGGAELRTRVRSVTGRALVRLGERIAPPARTPATR